jgi:hypothetical protein
MLSIQYYPFGCQNGQQNRQHASLRIAPSATPVLPAHAVHLLSEARFRQQYSTPGRQAKVEFLCEPSEPTRNVLILVVESDSTWPFAPEAFGAREK